MQIHSTGTWWVKACRRGWVGVCVQLTCWSLSLSSLSPRFLSLSLSLSDTPCALCVYICIFDCSFLFFLSFFFWLFVCFYILLFLFATVFVLYINDNYNLICSYCEISPPLSKSFCMVYYSVRSSLLKLYTCWWSHAFCVSQVSFLWIKSCFNRDSELLLTWGLRIVVKNRMTTNINSRDLYIKRRDLLYGSIGKWIFS